SEYIGHFHIGETNRRVPGRGHMPWDEIMDALCAINYQGRIVMEPFLKMGGQVGQDIKVWRDLSDDGDDAFMDAEAQYALKFMKGKLASR
ncbi:MAG: dolichol monophosphate mannose synthase, partial [Clostridia bacterium]